MRSLFTGIILLWTCAAWSQETLTVHFDFDKHSLTKEARAHLDSFLATRKTQTGYKISIDGHCDNTGSNTYNDALSRKRVLVVKRYLLKNGIASANITHTQGHGENQPLDGNETAIARKLNRRVQIITTDDQASVVLPGETKTLTEKLTDTATKAGTSIVLKNMNFYGGTPFLLPESFPIVDELLAVMRRQPALVIEIQGHICCVANAGDSPYGGTGNGLSEERARAIYAELMGKGIETSRVSYKGFGHSMPIYPYPEKTEEERVANRRVEIKIITK